MPHIGLRLSYELVEDILQRRVAFPVDYCLCGATAGGRVLTLVFRNDVDSGQELTVHPVIIRQDDDGSLHTEGVPMPEPAGARSLA